MSRCCRSRTTTIAASPTRRRRLRTAARLLALGAAGTAAARAVRARRDKAQAPPRHVGPAEWPPLVTAKEAAPAAQASAVVGITAVAAPAAAATTPWVDPVDGSCPVSHPVKGNASSGIYHVPGSRFYDMTIPERCYLDAAAAEADGMRAPKR